MSEVGPPKIIGVTAATESLFDEEEESSTIVDDGLFGEQQTDVPAYPAIAQFGRFEILGRLALGGMAEIFLARERGVHGAVRHLVIKRVLPHVADDEAFIRMFLVEAKVSTRLYHPNVCHLYEAGEIEGTYFMAMEWVYGTPLRRIIRRAREHGGLPSPIACRVIADIARGLHYAHTASDSSGQPLEIVHRDVSPHNIMVRWDGAVKLLDFGIAKAAIQEEQTEAGMVKGKYSYLSPEQCHGRDIDARADIFSLGICLFEALTGKPLYHRGAVLNTMTAIAKEAVPSARAVDPEISEELDRIVARALAKAPSDRFQTAEEMAEALESYIELTDEVVHAPAIGAYLDSLFTAADKSPLPEDVLRQTGSFPQLTPSGGYAAQSGSFGPFGQHPTRMPSVDVDIDVVIEDSSAMPLELPAPKKRWPIVVAIAAGSALAVAAAGAFAYFFL